MASMKSAYLALMASSLMFNDTARPSRGYMKESPELTPEQKKAIQQMKENYVNNSRGLKPFYYGETLVWAINKKNADRKAKKLGLI